MNDLKFSVSICVYEKDDPAHFRTAVDSILNQTLPPAEVVLVVDGPVPEELDAVIRAYEAKPLFRVIRFEANQGHGIARQTGLRHCQYEWIALMDADDVSVPSRFEKQAAYVAAHPEIAVVGGNIEEFIGEVRNVVGKRTVPTDDAGIKDYLKTRCPFNQVTVMLNRRQTEKVGGYIDWYCEEDYYLWLRLFLAGATFGNLEDTLVYVRVGEEMYERRGGVRYFKSEAKLQRYMLDNRVIGTGTYLLNVAKRLVVQVLLPNKLRGFVFKKFARE